MRYDYEKKYCDIALYKIPNNRGLVCGGQVVRSEDIYMVDREIEINSSEYWELLKMYSRLLKKLSEIDHEYYYFKLIID